MLAALVERDGGIVTSRRIVQDSRPAILEAMGEDVDIVIISGGSSVGIEDHAPTLLAEHGELVFHGLAMRPSSPTGLGRLGDRIVFLLPGNPVSCLCDDLLCWLRDSAAGRLELAMALPILPPAAKTQACLASRTSRLCTSETGRASGRTAGDLRRIDPDVNDPRRTGLS